MADFNAFFPTLLKHEGGFVNDPVDPGGATNKGITLSTFKAYAQNLLGIEPSLANLRALTDAQAGVIYKAQYWDRLRADQIALQPLANIVFDFYVNAGNNAIKLLQTVLNSQTGGKLVADGRMGPATFAALASSNQQDLYARYKAGRRDYYHRLVAARPALGKFLKGWLARVDSFPDSV
ncbi:glycosyl hydrolase 108 family protein [Xanthomonas euvesicatoria pv. eucalypti]|uniref:glycoside hydrolase family 108 protein n=1 Tax=Xanthomonas TaxID=338 RepID=UPI000226664F|nr:N-acetylmuramidase [Xanthomonas euvesicatoria]OHX23254.1 N-acetylmuramidase [Xanthomonas alfalfae]AEO41858.1 secretion activating protein [Xanthomonas euvesicatoria pv. citrumelo F1]MBV6800392.1 N-acetylmuramidase [Xanthomonas campestris pv. lawsoniae]MBV6805397.1 N-acetylmuramidase [Xanthomonas campestris pv. convolvuli]MBV6852364.1 N-acetylmuramidase [Xanthomonas campestris pv. mirabilis]